MKTFAALLILTLFSTSSGYNATPDGPTVVSLIQLIATPEKFDGKLVSVEGFLHIGREAQLLYLGQEDYKHGLDGDALWFHLDENMAKDASKLNRNYVGIVGVFNAMHRGPYGCPNGGIATVVRYAVWSIPSNPIGETLDESKPMMMTRFSDRWPGH